MWILLIKQIELIYADNEECLNYKQNTEFKNGLFQKIEKMLESESINLFQFESGIIRAKMKDI